MIKKSHLPRDILDRLSRLGPFLLKDHRIVFTYLFGGLASELVKPLSDVDIAVYLEPSVNFTEAKMDILGELIDALRTDEIDLVVLNTAPLSLAGRILRNRKVLTDRVPFQRHLYESRVMREFFDFRYLEDAILSRRFAHGG